MIQVTLHRELITRKNTRSGAIALRAPTKTSPRIEMPVAPGTAIPRMAPRISPTRIRFTSDRQRANGCFALFFHFRAKDQACQVGED